MGLLKAIFFVEIPDFNDGFCSDKKISLGVPSKSGRAFLVACVMLFFIIFKMLNILGVDAIFVL